jgi:hypothetical protein
MHVKKSQAPNPKPQTNSNLKCSKRFLTGQCDPKGRGNLISKAYKKCIRYPRDYFVGL